MLTNFKEKLLVLSFMLYWLCFNVLATETNSFSTHSRFDVSSRIDELFIGEQNSSLHSQLAEIELLIEVASSNEWHRSEIKAQAIRAGIIYALENVNEVTPIINEYLPLAISENMPKVTLHLKILKLGILDSQDNKVDSKKMRKELLTLAKKTEDNEDKADIYLALGESYYVMADLPLAQAHFLKSSELYQTVQNATGNALSLNGLANVYADLDEHQMAIKYYQEALVTHQSIDDKNGEMIILYNIGRRHIDLNAFSDAKNAIDNSMKIAESLDNKYAIAFNHFALADLEDAKNNHQAALDSYKKSQALFDELGDVKMVFTTKLGELESHIELKNALEAQIKVAELKQMSSVLEVPYFNIKFHGLYAQQLALSNNMELAYQIQRKFSNLLQQEHTQKKNSKIEELMLRYDTEKSELENAQLQKENAMQRLLITQQKSEKQLWTIGILFAVVIIFVCAFIAFIQIKHRNKYKQMALYDHLTKALNRRAILHKAETIHQNNLHQDVQLKVALVDLDNFKQINDKFGHDIGDKVLKAFASACFSTLRQTDIFGRYGGEEWLFIFCNNSTQDIIKIFQRLRENLNKLDVANFVDHTPISFSIGIAQYNPTEKPSLAQLIVQADESLYRAKNAGRNRIATPSIMRLLS